MELLIRVVDKGPDAGHTKAGHVIEAREDGWHWTPTERANPEWRIIQVPGLTRVEADALLAVHVTPSSDDAVPDTLVSMRKERVNIVLLPPRAAQDIIVVGRGVFTAALRT